MSAGNAETDAPESQPAEPNAAPSLQDLFIAFLWLGATAFGGAAMVVYIRQQAVDQRGWLYARDFDDRVALCQAVTGTTAMQTAAYVGLSARGVAGGRLPSQIAQLGPHTFAGQKP